MKNNNLSVFNNEAFGSVRTMVDEDSNVWFAASDVAKALGYAIPHKAISDHVDRDDVLIWNLANSSGYLRETKFINESGVYELIFSSKLESAKKFKKWITSEVIPSIRKTGSYSLNQKPIPSYMIEDEVERALAWIEEKKHTKALEQKVKEDEHKVNLYECFTGSEQGEMTMAEVAKAFSAKILKTSGSKPIGRNRFMEILRLNKIIDSNNIAYQRYIEAGYFKIKNSPRNGMNFFSTQWTPKGLDWLNRNADKLNSNQDIELD